MLPFDALIALFYDYLNSSLKYVQLIIRNTLQEKRDFDTGVFL